MKKLAALVIGTSLLLFAPFSQADFFSFQIGFGNFGYPSPYYYPYQPYGYYSYYAPSPYYYGPYPSYYIGNYYPYRNYYGHRYYNRKGNYYHRKHRQGNRSDYYRHRRWD